MPKFGSFFRNPVQAVSDLGSSIDDAITQPIVSTVKNVGSQFDDSVLSAIKKAGSSIEDEFDAALTDPILGPVISILANAYGGPAAVAALKYKQTGELSDALESGAKAFILQYVAANVMAPDANAVGGVTGPDNIDVGGGFNPAAGATAEELAAARAALDGAVSSPVYSPDLPVGTPLPPLTEPTLDEIIAELGTPPPVEVGPELLGEAGGNTFPLEPSQEGLIPPEPTLDEIIAELGTPAATNPAYAADNIDVGGGFNPATGAGDAATAAAAAANPPIYYPPVEIGPELLGEAGGNTFPLDAPLEGEIPLGGTPTVSDITNAIDPNAPDNIDAGGGWSPAAGASSAELTAARAAMVSKGLSFKDALDYVRAGLLVNALTGDPLGLAGDQPSGGGGGGDTGFAIVPVPAEWRSPTYAAPAAPIDINSLFTDMNLLGGTQWQGLPTQKPNLSFNDIFAAGKQKTPMGTPVDINQIVSAILGQNTASQKSA